MVWLWLLAGLKSAMCTYVRTAGVEAGSGKPNKEMVGQVTRKQVQEIAAKKLPDTNATKVESVMRMIEGTAKNMGIKVVD